jgi:hypothetical protein
MSLTRITITEMDNLDRVRGENERGGEKKGERREREREWGRDRKRKRERDRWRERERLG